MNRVHLVIHGRVQGVGFRYFVSGEARALGLRGTVRNRADGTVEVEAEGGPAALARLGEAVRGGAPAAPAARGDGRLRARPPPDPGLPRSWRGAERWPEPGGRES